jgi:hypothetical protein
MHTSGADLQLRVVPGQYKYLRTQTEEMRIICYRYLNKNTS